MVRNFMNMIHKWSQYQAQKRIRERRRRRSRRRRSRNGTCKRAISVERLGALDKVNINSSHTVVKTFKSQ